MMVQKIYCQMEIFYFNYSFRGKNINASFLQETGNKIVLFFPKTGDFN
jgi:hypothetical protein